MIDFAGTCESIARTIRGKRKGIPIFLRLRDDKPLAEIDTLARVREVYAEMLGREGLGP